MKPHEKLKSELDAVRAVVGNPPVPLTRATDEQIDEWEAQVKRARRLLGLPTEPHEYEHLNPKTATTEEEETDE